MLLQRAALLVLEGLHLCCALDGRGCRMQARECTRAALPLGLGWEFWLGMWLHSLLATANDRAAS